MKSQRLFVLAFASVLALGTGIVLAQTTGKPPAEAQKGPEGHHDSSGTKGPGMMGHQGMMGMCPLMGMGGATTKIEVKKLPKGVSISATSDDAKTVAKLQKMGEAMRLMHEASSE